ncbi:MAG: lipoprotein signal peptidase [Bacteroidetes bacterium]|nr:lipoprotein signal peptidase [Bacteroidota bacterium]MBX7127860.1 lipoprotein signal peptidase [Flavobacteriales bacterium]MCC6654588.1 lipoprotein signal peptidase [Flavobacteriales bacterium]HMZ47651.1 lipoprotein signal peptidase [Flavobacteriales bacterium]HNE80062.1 lipoprotein signal peptidase [Flavobacteriales bacterium]
MKRALLVIVLVLLTDQVLKVWVKTHFFLGEYIPMFGDNSSWAYLQFVENKGMAFGLEFGGEAGKLLLTLFRMVAVVAIGWVLRWMVREKQSGTRIISLALIFAGALGNIIDSAFYGLIFSASDPVTRNVAVIFPEGGGYAPFLHGAVVDMFYFPLWQGRFPDWMPVWGGEPFEFFRPVFNIADAAISVGVALMILFQRKDKPDQPEPLRDQPGTPAHPQEAQADPEHPNERTAAQRTST